MGANLAWPEFLEMTLGPSTLRPQKRQGDLRVLTGWNTTAHFLLSQGTISSGHSARPQPNEQLQISESNGEGAYSHRQ